jgi:competence protein ComEC
MKKIRIIVLFIFFISFLACAFAQEPDLKIHFIDVGEGDSVLIEAPDGEAALVDAGNLISGYRVLEYLKKRNIQILDYLIFTHPHPDHIGGAFFVLQMIDVESIYDNGQDLTDIAKSIDMYRWYEELVRSSSNYKVLKAEDNLLLGDITLSVLWPPQPPIFSDFNANSLVMVLKYGKFRCLLTGDLTSVSERKLLEQGIDLKADVLKVGHHGAKDASCQEFLRSVSPRMAIISVNAANIRGYPSGEVVDRLNKGGIELYRTDRDGDVTLSVYQLKDDEYEIRIKKSKKR